MFFLPYKLDTIFTRLPISNLVIIAITTLMFFLTASGSLSDETIEALVLQNWDLQQMVGNAFLHADIFHIAGNMLFLWVFGSAICASVGNVAYPFLYLFLAISASSAHLLFSGQPAIGASGAVNGIIGLALILFPMNKLHCFYAYSMPFAGVFWKSGKFSVKSYAIIIVWVVLDILGVLLGGGGIAYWAHLGGFTIGVVIGISLLLFNAVEPYDPTLIEVITGQRKERTAYTLEELAQLPETPTATVAQIHTSLNEQSVTPQAKVSATSPPASPGKEPVPSFRVLKTLQKGQDFFCYFVNEGDSIGEVMVESSEPAGADFQPAKVLGKKTPGWIRLGSSDPSGLKAFSLRISYTDGSGMRLSRELSYSEADRKIHLT